MTTQQPKWKYVANLGDATPLTYGGLFVFVDETGVYPPEMERIELDNENEEDEAAHTYTVWRVVLDPCTFVEGVLSDNAFHPESPAWWADELDALASFIDADKEELVALFVSDEPKERAEAYRTVGDYHGWDNLDSYPLTLSRAEAEERYKGQGLRL